MKQLLFALSMFAFLSTSAQKKKPGYFSMRGGAAFIDDGYKGIGHISFGASPDRTIGIGAGIGFVHIDKLYVPLTVDISFFGTPGKISPIIIGSAGYGLYNNKNTYFTTKGGFTGSLNAGIALPAKKSTKLFLTGGYSIYSFTGGQNIQTAGSSYKAKDNIKVFTITLGVKV
jgi:hypothetical protein